MATGGNPWFLDTQLLGPPLVALPPRAGALETKYFFGGKAFGAAGKGGGAKWVEGSTGTTCC